jgi:hypothetical protein
MGCFAEALLLRRLPERNRPTDAGFSLACAKRQPAHRRYSRPMEAGCRHVDAGRDGVLPSKNVKIHRTDAECAEGPRRSARKRTFTRRGSRSA